MRRFRLTLDVPDEIPDDYYRATILNALQNTFRSIQESGACQGSTRCSLDVTDDEGVRHIANTKVNFDWASPDVIGAARAVVDAYDASPGGFMEPSVDALDATLNDMESHYVKS